MTWLHTWFGLVLGFVLMVAFFFGSLAVFAPEIDRWALPETRFEPSPLPSFDATLKPLLEALDPEPEDLVAARERTGLALKERLQPLYWSVDRNNRGPSVGLYAEMKVENPKNEHDYVHGHAALDPRTGARVHESGLAIGSDFFYPMHFTLHLAWLDLGIWLVGVAALMMLAALVSGVVIHKKIFREFFTFRPDKRGQRRVLDLHNLTGVVALPFHFLFAFTGLFIFAGIYLPFNETMFERLHEQQEQRSSHATGRPHERAGIAAPLASVDAMVTAAEKHWAAQGTPSQVGGVSVMHVGDANAIVAVYALTSDRLKLSDDAVYFQGPSGRMLPSDPPPSAVRKVGHFLMGLHLMPFEHWPLRWLFVMGGLTGTACIATGMIFFVGKRQRKHAAAGVQGARWVDALATTSVTGMLIATTAILVANRLLPASLSERGAWEERVFWAAWLLAFAHAALRSAAVQAGRFAPAWREQCWAIALLASSAVALNWLTTGDHLGRTLARGYWPVAGFDLALLTTAALATFAARRLARHEANGVTAEASDSVAPQSA